MRSYFIILFLLITLIPGKTQGYYNGLYEYSNHGTLTPKAIVINDTIIVSGATRDLNDLSKWCIFMMRLDTFGQIIDSSRICDPNSGTLIGSEVWSDLKPTSDSGFILTAAEFESYDGVFVKVDKNLDLEIFQEYPDSISSVEFYSETIELDIGYLLGGTVQRPNALLDGFIRKTNLDGTSIYHEFLGDLDKDEALIDFILRNDTIIGVGYHQLITGDEFSNRPWVIYLDLDGNVLHEKRESEDVGFFSINRISPLSNGEWVFVGRMKCQNFQGNDAYCTGVGTLDANFNLISISPVGFAEPYTSFLHSLSPAINNSDFIASGKSKVPNNSGSGPPVLHSGWIVRFTETGDTLWSNTFIPPTNTPANEGYFSGAGELSSGSIIAVGTARLGIDYYYWLVKMSPDGCIDTINCISLSNNVLGVIDQQSYLKVYPNPADSQIEITLSSTNNSGHKIHITSIDGRIMHSEDANSNLTINSSSWSEGMYIIHAFDPHGKYISKKLVVFHKD
ncbi:MAG: T9SS type A sorting domain-containing protein [Saprospiraceae bacterium]